jgi:MFS family permease
MELAGRFGALEERPFRLLWLGSGISTVGDMLVPVAIAFAVLGVGGSATDLGRVMAASVLARVLLTLVGGVWGDRLPRQVVMLVSDLVRAVSQGLIGLLLITGRADVWHLLLGGLVYGSAAAFFKPASTGLLPSVVSGERLQQANALMSLTRSAAFVAGPATAGVLVAAFGPGWVFVIDALTFVCSAVFLLMLPLPRALTAVRQRFVADLVDGWRELATRNWAWASIAFFSIFNLAIAQFFVLGPVVAERELGGASDWGFVMSGAGMGALLGSAFALRLRPEKPLRFGLSLSVLAALLPLTLARPFPAPVVATATLVGIAAITLGNTLWVTALQEHVPREALSRVAAYEWMGSELFMPLGYILAGPLAASLGLDATLWAAGAVLAISSLAVVSVPSVRSLPRGRLVPAGPGEAFLTSGPLPSASAAGESRG